MEGEAVYKEIEELVNNQIQEHQHQQEHHIILHNNHNHVQEHEEQEQEDEQLLNSIINDTISIPIPIPIHIDDNHIQLSSIDTDIHTPTHTPTLHDNADDDDNDNNTDPVYPTLIPEDTINNDDIKDNHDDNKHNDINLDICRVCLSDDKENLQCIFSGGVSEQVRTVASIDLDKDDGMPQFICFDCRQELAIAVKFKSKCESSDSELRNKLGIKMKTIVKTELVLLEDNVEIISDEEVDEDEDEDVEESKPRKRKQKKFIVGSSDEDFQENFYRSDDPDWTGSEEETLIKPKKKKHKRHSSREHGRKKSVPSSFQAELGDSVQITIKKSADGTYPCPYCEKRYPYPSTLKLHLPTHKNKMLKCVLCTSVFVSEKQLYYHYKQDHPAECSKVLVKSLKCETCGETLSSKSALKAHEATHVQNHKYKCPKCPQTFNNLTSLNLHKKQDHTDSKKPYECKICDKRFKHSSSLEKHMESHRYKPKIRPQLSVDQKTISTKELFKSIAPPTTTYWSDSLSD